MRLLVIANWKCNPTTIKEAKLLFNAVEKGVRGVKNTDLAICPPFVYLLEFGKINKGKVKLGGQDCFWENSGAFTGEISPAMLKNLGCQYVIIGHLERRKHQKETEEMIARKVRAARKAGLKPILCVEKPSQARGEFKDLIIAYEPTFAIGTGKACSIEKAKKIRKALASFNQVLYGGSVSSKNAQGYLKDAGFQGLLVGGVSLNPEEFLKTIKNIDSIR